MKQKTKSGRMMIMTPEGFKFTVYYYWFIRNKKTVSVSVMHGWPAHPDKPKKKRTVGRGGE